jgi:putative transposase
MPPNRRVTRLLYKQAFSMLNEHLVMHEAPNSYIRNEELLESLAYLSLGRRYAESGLEDLRCTREAPSADTLLRRLKMIGSDEAYTALVRANDEVIVKLKRRGMFRMPVLAAMDLSDDRFYGKYNRYIRRSKRDRGTNLFYTHASLHVVEHGRRATIFTAPVLQLDDHARIVERLILEGRRRGIRVHTLLLDRGFFSVDVMNVLRRHRVRFLMPAVKNDRIKEVIGWFHLGRVSPMTRFTMENAEQHEASFNLLIYRKKDAKEGDPVHKRCITFATNMPYQEAMMAFGAIPEEYRKRWGIETGFRVQDNVQAKTTSTNYTVRTVYLMLSIFLYNVWVLLNAIMAGKLGIIEPKTPLMKLSHMVKFFAMWIEQPGGPPH